LKKIKYENKSKKSKCWACRGIGFQNTNPNNLIVDILVGKKLKKCPICKGTGKWTETFYYLHYTDKEGNKFCFGVDGLK